MTCPHTARCPLFPLMNQSLDGWRRCYCDSHTGWRECARYELSAQGQVVPLGLLPNGRHAKYIQQHAGGTPAAGSVAVDDPIADPVADPVAAAAAAPVADPDPDPDTAAAPVAVPVRDPARHRFQQVRWPDWPGHHEAPVPVSVPSLVPRPRPPAEAALSRHGRDTTPRRRWWSRLAEWMRSEA